MFLDFRVKWMTMKRHKLFNISILYPKKLLYNSQLIKINNKIHKNNQNILKNNNLKSYYNRLKEPNQISYRMRDSDILMMLMFKNS